jgi:hypothetical protein
MGGQADLPSKQGLMDSRKAFDVARQYFHWKETMSETTFWWLQLVHLAPTFSDCNPVLALDTAVFSSVLAAMIAG